MPNITIHRGTNEIGGSCVEISNSDSSTRILFDYGIPLSAMDNESFNVEDYKLKLNAADIKAIFLSHAHPDHYGLLETIKPSIPIYCSIETYNVLKKIAPLTTKYKSNELNLQVISNSLKIDDFEIIPHKIDHSICGSYAFEIKSDNKTILYTGDIRFHGRTKFNSLKLRQDIKSIDYMIMEGTTLSRAKQDRIEEKDLEEKFITAFEEDKLNLVIFSPQNLDRLITVYKACLKTNKTLVIDPYTAYSLALYGESNKNIPQFNWKNIKIYFAKNSITQSLIDNQNIKEYGSKKISKEEILNNPKQFVVKGNFRINNYILNSLDKNKYKIIYSMWKGYLDKPSYLDDYKDNIEFIHTSGHAYIEDLQKLVENLKPKHIIPIHTECKNMYKDLFGADIKVVDDAEIINI